MIPDKKDWPGGPPCLAINYDDIEVITFPMLGQPKLNGIRACWDGTHLISRQRKVWKPETLPHIYEKLREFTSRNPGVYLDGELYGHGMAFQEITPIVAVHRISAHNDCHRIEYHAFDIISREDTESRQLTLSQIYKPWTAVCKVMNPKDADIWTNRFVEAGFEGLMLRSYGCPYLHGKTEGLIKVKPWKYGRGRVTGYTPGEGKYKGMLGAVCVSDQKEKPITFNVSGGLSDLQRAELPAIIHSNQRLMMPMYITYRYRELSRAGKPLQPQIVKI